MMRWMMICLTMMVLDIGVIRPIKTEEPHYVSCRDSSVPPLYAPLDILSSYLAIDMIHSF